MNRVIHFEFGAVDPERAARFYREVFGWNIQKWGEQPYWLVTTGAKSEPGIDGGIMRHQDGQPRTVIPSAWIPSRKSRPGSPPAAAN